MIVLDSLELAVTLAETLFKAGLRVLEITLRTPVAAAAIEKIAAARAAGAIFGVSPGTPADLRFCPTGGIGPVIATDCLALPNVACVGGSWIVPPKALAQRDWRTIARLARTAAAHAL